MGDAVFGRGFCGGPFQERSPTPLQTFWGKVGVSSKFQLLCLERSFGAIILNLCARHRYISSRMRSGTAKTLPALTKKLLCILNFAFHFAFGEMPYSFPAVRRMSSFLLSG